MKVYREKNSVVSTKKKANVGTNYSVGKYHQ